jgi:hypothetical protein
MLDILRNAIPTNVKTEIFIKQYIYPLGSETWVMLDKHKSRVTSSEMKYQQM